tara:strand:+ start:135 stop:896 length:762 start_codon:yes stop_codon:yes gene_type:complete
MDFSNKNILITGSSGLIGLKFSEHVLKNNGNVILGDLDDKSYYYLKKRFDTKKIYFIQIDVNNANKIDQLIKKGVSKFGKIYGAVHCSYPKSKNWGKEFEKIKQRDLNFDLNSQLGGTIIFSQRIIKQFKNQGFGNLILISSILGISAPKFDQYKGTKIKTPIEYSAIKSGIISITRYLAKYLKNKNIRVNCISPGGLKNSQPKKFIRKYKANCLSKGLLDPEDLIGTLNFLLSKDSKYINGQNIVIDDGWSL